MKTIKHITRADQNILDIVHLMNHPEEVRKLMTEQTAEQKNWLRIMPDTDLKPGDKVRYGFNGKSEERTLNEMAISQGRIPYPGHGTTIPLTQCELFVK